MTRPSTSFRAMLCCISFSISSWSVMYMGWLTTHPLATASPTRPPPAPISSLTEAKVNTRTQICKVGRRSATVECHHVGQRRRVKVLTCERRGDCPDGIATYVWPTPFPLAMFDHRSQTSSLHRPLKVLEAGRRSPRPCRRRVCTQEEGSSLGQRRGGRTRHLSMLTASSVLVTVSRTTYWWESKLLWLVTHPFFR